MATPLNSTKGAALIDAAIAPERGCSRQNLEKLCEKGGLLGSPCILRAKPLLVDADILLDEYLARVAPFQVEAVQPAAKRRPAAQAPAKPSRPSAPGLADDDLGTEPDADDEKVPNFNDERALHEREKRLIARMERMEKAKELVYRADHEIAYNAVLLQLTTKAASAHKQIKAEIPHLTHDELTAVERVIAEIFEEVSSHSFEELPE